MPKHFDLVIVGNSAAGLQAIRTLRRHNRQVSVALIDREDCTAYSRVLTPYFVGGKTPRDNLFIVDGQFYRQMGITTILGKAATALDCSRKLLTLEDGSVVEYGKLLLATGAEARTLSHRSGRSSTLRHMTDAETLAQQLPRAKSIAAIGAGLVSVPFLSHASPEVEKHLIVGSNRVFSRVVDAETAGILEDGFVKAGLKLHKRDDIAAMAEGDRLELTLKSGTRFSVDMLVVGKGVTPNTNLARSAGIEVNDGVIIDDCCRTSCADVFAAGDAAEGRDFVTGEATVQGNWITAVEQGEVAALNMLGLECRYEGSLKNNITEVFGMEVAAVGYCGDDAPNSTSAHNPFTGRFRKVFLDEQDRVIGATMINETNDAGVYYQLVKTRSKLPEGALLSGTNSYAGRVRQIA